MPILLLFILIAVPAHARISSAGSDNKHAEPQPVLPPPVPPAIPDSYRDDGRFGREKTAEQFGKLMQKAFSPKDLQRASQYKRAAAEIGKQGLSGGVALGKLMKDLPKEREQEIEKMVGDQKLLDDIFGTGKFQGGGEYYADLIKWGLNARRLQREGKGKEIPLPEMRGDPGMSREAIERDATEFLGGFLQGITER